MKVKLILVVALGIIATESKGGITYSCTAVLPNKIYVPAGQTTFVNAQVDCYFLTGLGSTYGASSPIDIPVDKSMINQIQVVGNVPTKLASLTHFPAQNGMFAFQYIPTQDANIPNRKNLKGVPIQVVIRSEPMTSAFISQLNNQLATAQNSGNTAQATELSNILNGIQSKSLVQIYRRLPSMGETMFKPMVTKIFANAPEAEIADINILPTGNLQIIEHMSDGKLLLDEESFGAL